MNDWLAGDCESPRSWAQEVARRSHGRLPLVAVRGTLICAAACALGLISGCGERVEAPVEGTRAAAVEIGLPDEPLSAADVQPSRLRFADVTAETGIEFTYYGSPSSEHYMPEQNGGGVALADFDGDDLCDVFLANGSHFDRPAEEARESNRLFRAAGTLNGGTLNGGTSSGGPLNYDDVTAPAGLLAFGFGMGCAAADFDNDGFIDLFVAGYGGNRLWHNAGDGTFHELLLDAGSARDLWSTSAAFADLDGDGNLDLYVVNYVAYAPDDPPCYTQHQPPVQISCGPLGRTGVADLLYHSQGDGRFADVTGPSGVASARGKGLGLSIADFDGDGRLDIYVANDTTPNLLWHNLGGMRFEDVAMIQGCAVGSDGVARSGMGVGCGDYNADGRFDLVVTNFENEPNDLYENLGPTGFRTRNTEMRLDSASRPMLGFGVVLADFDLDRFPDLFVANGHVWDLTALGLGYRYAMPPQLFQNEAGRQFQDVSATAGEYFQKEWIGRAAAAADLDRDGDLDLVVTHLVDPVRILRNDSARAGGGMRLRVVGTASARTPAGITIELTIDGQTQTLRVPAGDSFQSSFEPLVVAAVGETATIDAVRVHWSAARSEVWRNVPVAPLATLVEGTGTVAANP